MESCTSPIVPRIFTLLSTRFSPPTSCASVCISPKPFCTFPSCLLTSSNDCPMRSCRVFCNFSSTVARISSSFFSVFCKSSCWRSDSSPNFSRCRRLNNSMLSAKLFWKACMAELVWVVIFFRVSRCSVRKWLRVEASSSRSLRERFSSFSRL